MKNWVLVPVDEIRQKILKAFLIINVSFVSLIK